MYHEPYSVSKTTLNATWKAVTKSHQNTWNNNEWHYKYLGKLIFFHFGMSWFLVNFLGLYGKTFYVLKPKNESPLNKISKFVISTFLLYFEFHLDELQNQKKKRWHYQNSTHTFAPNLVLILTIPCFVKNITVCYLQLKL